jgi:hypothetical protein
VLFEFCVLPGAALGTGTLVFDGDALGGLAGAEVGVAGPGALVPADWPSGGLLSAGLVPLGLFSEAGLVGRRKVGGLSSSSRGFDSACSAVDFFGAAPASSQSPSASQAFVCCCCNTFLTVNKPIGLPVRCASYTVPFSSAMGTGFAL